MGEKNEQSGAALATFIVALADNQDIVDKILADANIESIDPETWYDYEWAVAFFYRIERELGKAALTEIGRSMIQSALFPPQIDSVEVLLGSLDAWFKLNARGPDVGGFTCEFEDEHAAVIENSAWGPCSLNLGVIAGACSRFGVKPLIEHAAGGCQDPGDGRPSTCVYRVSW